MQKAGLEAALAAGTQFVNISPLQSDLEGGSQSQWLAIRPNTDVALMLGLAHVMLSESLHNQAFLDRYTVGFDQFAAYLRGETDGVVKSAAWASEICELPTEVIEDLARRMAKSRTMISVSWSLTRQDHGEQPFFAHVAQHHPG